MLFQKGGGERGGGKPQTPPSHVSFFFLGTRVESFFTPCTISIHFTLPRNATSVLLLFRMLSAARRPYFCQAILSWRKHEKKSILPSLGRRFVVTCRMGYFSCHLLPLPSLSLSSSEGRPPLLFPSYDAHPFPPHFFAPSCRVSIIFRGKRLFGRRKTNLAPPKMLGP